MSAVALKSALLPVSVPVVALVLWELGGRSGFLDVNAVPPPSAVLTAAGEELASGDLWSAAAHSLTAAFVGWAIAAAAGFLIGLVLGLSGTARLLSETSIDFARAIPAVALVPVAILIFGFDIRAELLVVAFAALWPMLVNTAAGISGVAPELTHVAATLRLTPTARTVKVVIPAALPQILVGMRLSMATAVILTAVAEMTGNPSGIGNELVLAQTSLRPATAMLYTLTIGVLGLALNAGLVVTMRALFSRQLRLDGQA